MVVSDGELVEGKHELVVLDVEVAIVSLLKVRHLSHCGRCPSLPIKVSPFASVLAVFAPWVPDQQ
jgi:hypothetical protein